MGSKERIDKLLVDRGLVKSRERAKALIMEGKVVVPGSMALKAGTMVDREADITLKDQDIPFVGRGGLKLDAALEHFHLDVAGKVVLDVGCSTGGFTDCVLQRKALRVYAVDVGYGQFDWSLRNDPRVVLMEKTNFRYLDRQAIPEGIDLAVADVSFISLLKVLPKIAEFLHDSGEVLALVKPQFEVGKGMVDKGGIVRLESARLAAVESVRAGAGQLGFLAKGVFTSPVRGQKGNVEYFIYLGRN
ncbi:MAG: TlyA family RNA methyltransferase [Thermodesulfovibrionales bacterium]